MYEPKKINMSPGDPEDRQNYNRMLVAETAQVLADPVFHRSPVLSRLLKYLVDMTLKGSADTLSSFAVAVDGLGRPDSFDAASDSSARVQMVRLRKALASYYAQHGPADGHSIYLLPASYRVRMAALPDAYPNLFSARVDPGSNAPNGIELPLITREAISSAEASAKATLTLAPKFVNFPSFGSSRFFVTAVLVAALISVASWFVWRQFVANPLTPRSPVVELMPVEVVNSADTDVRANQISTIFINDLPRFKISRVRVIAEKKDLKDSSSSAHVYRLYPRLEKNLLGDWSLFLLLNDVRTDTILWSRELKIPDDPRAISNTIIPVISEINGPFGVIASHESIIYRDWNSGGYACVLKYFRFVATRTMADELRVRTCENMPVEEEHILPTMLAVRALFALERSDRPGNVQLAAKQGMKFAHSAVTANPNDGFANFASARLSYTLNDCVSANFYTNRTLETNALSPMFTATLAALAETCAYPGSEKLLDQALLVQNSTYAKGRMLLVMAALAQNRPEKIKDIVASDLPDKMYNQINYYLTETLIAVSQGNRADAARNWKLFSQLVRAENRTPDAKLQTIVLHPVMRRRMIALLQQGGAFGPG